MKEVCKECQCNNCYFAIPDGGIDDCHNCDLCLENEPMKDCSKHDPMREDGVKQ